MTPLETLSHLAGQTEAIDVLWLYGSRARGDAHRGSDYDLAAALAGPLSGDDRCRIVEDFEYAASRALDEPVSCVDINRAPVALATAVINEGRVLFCRSYLRLRAEEQRVWSLWEAYKYEHERLREAL